MFRLEQYRFGIARFLLCLYVAVLVNGIVFRHAHRLADGTIICHAHPYSSPGTQFPAHTHSSDELIWLNAFTNALYANPDAFSWTTVLIAVLSVVAGNTIAWSVSFSLKHLAFRHRGPPAR